MREQIEEAQRLYKRISHVQVDLKRCIDEQLAANSAYRDAEELLRNAENEVKARAVVMQDERLPKAKTSDDYKVAMKVIIAEAHTDELRSEVEEYEECRQRADEACVQTEKARIALNAYKSQAQLMTAILQALAGVGDV